MVTDIKTSSTTFGPLPNTIGNGPMNTTPPNDEEVGPAELPMNRKTNPTSKRRKPTRYRREGPIPYRRLTRSPSASRTIASRIATIVHFVSLPKIIGMGPIIITPAALISVLFCRLSRDDSTVERSIVTIPAITNMKPTSEYASTSRILSGPVYISARPFPIILRWQSTGTARNA